MVDCRLRDERGGNPNLRHRRLGLVENARLLVICQSSAASFQAAPMFWGSLKRNNWSWLNRTVSRSDFWQLLILQLAGNRKNIVIIYLSFNGEK